MMMVLNDDNAEHALLGCLLLAPEELGTWAANTEPTIFHDPRNQCIFAAAKGLLSAGNAADAVTVRDALVTAGDLDKAGGSAYMAALFDAVPSVGGWEHYRDIVERNARRRGVLTGLHSLERDIMSGADLGDVRDGLWGLCHGLAPRNGSDRTVNVTEALRATMAEIEAHANGGDAGVLPTGFPDIDVKLGGGLQPRHVYIVAARTSVGKTSFVESIGRNILLRTAPSATVLWFTLETGTAATVRALLGG